MTPGAVKDRIRETRMEGPVPAFTQPDWRSRFPWLAQGTTGRGEGPPFDLGLRGNVPVGSALERWRALGDALGFARMAHARQVHGARVLTHDGGPPGLLLCDGYDGHVTATPGVLLTVSVADCVPVFLVDARRRATALLHAGWRGIAASVLEEGLRTMIEVFATEPADLHMHLGPHICGRCYEVGPEVFRALDLDAPAGPAPVDLAEVLTRRAVRAGVPRWQISTTAHCTRCGDAHFFSYRAQC
ncbi:MAG: polyphenol oxidase family protein, partial [Gemmatimonadota bacterium]